MPGILAQKGDGLLDTHVTWQDIEEEICKFFGPNAKLGPNKTIRRIGEGMGFLSRVGIITPDWQDTTTSLPSDFVVKICSQLVMHEVSGECEITRFLEERSPRFHNFELITYDLFDKYGNGNLPVPKIYGGRRFSETNDRKGFLIMGTLKDAVNIHLFDILSVDNMKELIRGVAQWQILSLKFTEEECKQFPYDLLSVFFGEGYLYEIAQLVTEGIELIGHPELSKRIEGYNKFSKEITSTKELKILDELSEILGMKQRVYGHCDLWCPNVLWKKTTEGLRLLAIFDFQLAAMTSPALDLAMVLACHMNGEDRRAHWKEILEDYYEYMLENLNGISMPFTLEQLKENYLRIFPLAGLLVLPMIGTVWTDIEKTEKHKQAIEDKMIPLLDDMIELHNRNMKLPL